MDAAIATITTPFAEIYADTQKEARKAWGRIQECKACGRSPGPAAEASRAESATTAVNSSRPGASKNRPENCSLFVRVHKGLAVAKRLTQNPGVWISISYHRQILDAMFGEVFPQNPLLDGKRICDVASTHDAAAGSAQC